MDPHITIIIIIIIIIIITIISGPIVKRRMCTLYISKALSQ